jgi:hypothetical protein
MIFLLTLSVKIISIKFKNKSDEKIILFFDTFLFLPPNSSSDYRRNPSTTFLTFFARNQFRRFSGL